jgi:hypothetical protein
LLALTPQSVAAGNTGTGTVLLSAPAPEGGTVLAVKSEQPAIVSVPESVLVPAKAAGARFPILTHTVDETTAVRVSIAAGEMRRSNTILVLPLLRPVQLSAPKVKGGATVVATVALFQRAAAGTITATLSSNSPEVVSTPAEVKISAGANLATFEIATRAVASETAVTVTVSVGGCTRSAILTVTP